MPDTTPSMQAQSPQDKPTVRMEPPPPWAIELSKRVAEGFQGVETRLTTIEGNQTLQGGQVLDIGRRMTEVERRVGGLEEGRNANSIRVKSITDNDIKHDAAIGSLVADVATLKDSHKALTESQAKQTEYLEQLIGGGKALLKNPKFIALASALYAYAMYWLGKHGGVP